MPAVDGGAGLSERGLWVQHEIFEGSFEDPVELVAEGRAVGDGSRFGSCAVVLSLNENCLHADGCLFLLLFLTSDQYNEKHWNVKEKNEQH